MIHFGNVLCRSTTTLKPCLRRSPPQLPNSRNEPTSFATSPTNERRQASCLPALAFADLRHHRHTSRMVAVESFAACAHRRSTGQKLMKLSNAVVRLLLLGYCAAVFLLFGSDTFAAVLIRVGAGWYRRNPRSHGVKPNSPLCRTRRHDNGRRQAPSLPALALGRLWQSRRSCWQRIRGMSSSWLSSPLLGLSSFI